MNTYTLTDIQRDLPKIQAYLCNSSLYWDSLTVVLLQRLIETSADDFECSAQFQALKELLGSSPRDWQKVEALLRDGLVLVTKDEERQRYTLNADLLRSMSEACTLKHDYESLNERIHEAISGARRKHDGVPQ